MISFSIVATPTPQARARRGWTRDGRPITHKLTSQQRAEDVLRALLEPYRPAVPLSGPLRLLVRIYLPIPASWSRKKQVEAMSGKTKHTSRPDLDNLLKQIKDCLSPWKDRRGVKHPGFWVDDRLVYEYLPGTGKYYDDGRGPRWEIEIIELSPGKPEKD